MNTISLGEILKLEYGKPLPKDQRKEDGKYPAYGANGIKARTDSFYVSEPGIIVGRKGSAGALTLTEGHFWPLDVTYYVSFDKSKYDLKYIYRLLSTLNLPSFATGVKPGINRNEIHAISVQEPGSIEDQRETVKILDAAFEKIDSASELARKNLVNMDQLKTALLAKAFKNASQDII